MLMLTLLNQMNVYSIVTSLYFKFVIINKIEINNSTKKQIDLNNQNKKMKIKYFKKLFD